MNAAPRRRAGGLRRTVSWLRWTVFALVFWFFVVPLVPGFGEAIDELRRVDRSMLLLGTALEFAALWFYSLLTHAALGPEARRLRVPTLFRIQLSTRALGSIVPGGSAASTASRRCFGMSANGMTVRSIAAWNDPSERPSASTTCVVCSGGGVAGMPRRPYA